MSEYRTTLQRELERLQPPRIPFDQLARRRDRKRRNQRIAAGVVGIAVFVAAVWIVTSVGSFDRTQTPAVPGLAQTGPTVTGPTETGPRETGPAEAAPPPFRASASPDEVFQKPCSGDARSRLELTDIGRRIKARFEVHRSPVGHSWRIVIRHSHTFFPVFVGTRVASDSGDLAAQQAVLDYPAQKGVDWFVAKARDRQTGQFCRIVAEI